MKIWPQRFIAAFEARLAKMLNVREFNQSGHYSHFGFRPVRHEVEDYKMTVTGTLPKDLEGLYVRNGTNSAFDDNATRHHVFNGAGMVHMVQIKDGEARYSNQYIRTPRFEAETQAGQSLYTEFGNIVGTGKAGLFSIILGALKKKIGLAPKIHDLDNSSSTTAVLFHSGNLYCLQETARPFALNVTQKDGWVTIDGSGYVESFSGQLNTPFSAHPKRDPKTDRVHAFSTDIKSGAVQYMELNDGKLVVNECLYKADPALAFLHDYYITENHTVFPDGSLRFSPKGFLGPHKSPFYFEANQTLKFGVLKRCHEDMNLENRPEYPSSISKDIHWFDTGQAGHIWHTINAWEEMNEDGTVDIIAYAPVYREYPSDIPIHTKSEPHATLMKFRLNMANGSVTEATELLSHFYERPSINLDYLGQKNRYTWLIDEEKAGIMGKGIMKYDLQNEAELDYFDYGEYFGGEALFVSRPNPDAEDDGYLLELLMKQDRAALLILDAKSMTEMARLHMPQRVPFGVHACWLNQAQISKLDVN